MQSHGTESINLFKASVSKNLSQQISVEDTTYPRNDSLNKFQITGTLSADWSLLCTMFS